MGQNGLFNLVSLVFETAGWGFMADMNMDIVAFNSLLFRISAREVNSGFTGEVQSVGTIFEKYGFPGELAS